MTPSHEIAVVGAGPVGLAVALGLARRGRRVVVLERESDTAEHSRAPAIWPRTQEVLEDLGVVERFLAEGIQLPRLVLHDVDRGAPLLRLPLEELRDRTRHPRLLVLPQSRTEQLLLAALRDQPTAEVRFSTEVIGLSQQESAVELDLAAADRVARLRARFVVGCDGAHSFVREAIGADLEGRTFPQRVALADLRLDDTAGDPTSPRLTTQPRLAIAIRIAERLWRLILPRLSEPGVGLEQRIEEAALRLLGGRPWQPVWRSEFSLHDRISTVFHDRRVVLAGDAAHLNSPVGGQGMNAGIQDAAQLLDPLCVALDRDVVEPLAAFARQRRRQVRRSVNRFTTLATRLLLGSRGRLVRPSLQLVDAAIRIPPIRRRLLARVAMLA
ncbi:MAG: FAD-dependent monooxygenase [Acidobacteria bacterium]|nr:MAG: FAD-dependent monooxygenase [Acidobacteriota bacterium]